MKILSTYFSYYNLGMDFKFKTKFKLNDQTLEIEGDPLFMFSDNKFRDIISTLENDINSIRFKNIYLTPEKYHPDWTLEDINYCYGAQVTPFAINENCDSYPHTSNKTKPVHQKENYLKILKTTKKENDRKEIGGRTDVNISYHEMNIGEIITHILELSCNFSAELLMRYTASKISERKVSWLNSANMVMELFLDNGITKDDLIVRDGSGLSRLNMASTLLLSKISSTIFLHNPEFYNFFPSPGKGTLKNRLLNLRDYDIKAKTGTISYISSLTGTSRAHNLFFSIIVYGIENTKERERTLDKTLEKILRKT